MAVNVRTRSAGALHTIALTIADPSAFHDWRVEVRNRVDYLRRIEPHWRSFGLHGWLQRDGTIRGIVSLGALGPAEIMKGFARWNAVLGAQIDPEDLRVAIWNVTKPSVISLETAGGRRYQGRHLSIYPRRVVDAQHHLVPEPRPTTSDGYDPMPVLIS